MVAHLDKIAVNIGDVLSAGQQIGTQGITGRATGPHVSTHINALNGGDSPAVLRAVENAFVKGTVVQSATQAARSGAAPAAATPALQSLDVAAPSLVAYTEAVRGLGSAMERVRALVAALTEARTAAAFEAIAKAAFPQVQLEGYQDSLAEAQLTYEAIAVSAADAFNPERTALAVQANVQVARSATELAQIQTEVAKRENLSAAEKKKLIEQTTKAQADYVAGVREAERIQSSALGVKQAGELLKALKEGTKATYDEITAVTLRNKLELQGLSPERVQAELNKVQIQKDTEATLKNINELLTIQLNKRDELATKIAAAAPADQAALNEQLRAALATIATLQAQLAALPTATTDRMAAEDARATALTPSTNPRDIVQKRINDLTREAAALTNLGNMAVTVADGIGSAFSTSFKGIIDGSMTARQAMGNFFQSLADMFLEMATQMIAKMIMMAVLNQVLGVLPGFSGGGVFGGGAGLSSGFSGTGSAVGGWNFFADGGAFAQNGIIPFANGGIVNSPTMFKFAKGGAMSTGVMGEAGPEAIMPLSRGANGKLGVLNMGGDGGGTTNVTVNVDASGSKAQGDTSKSEQLGRAVSQAVQDELLRQKRPGGLLA
jgi:lambda family phage tail tape measure protein